MGSKLQELQPNKVTKSLKQVQGKSIHKENLMKLQQQLQKKAPIKTASKIQIPKQVVQIQNTQTLQKLSAEKFENKNQET